VRRPGQVALMSFPQVDLAPGKRRPVLLVVRVPGPYEDWLVCMFSTNLQQALPDFDEVIGSDANDFHKSGLRVPSAIRVARLAMVSADLLVGTIGEIDDARLRRIQQTLACWIRGEG
jgi:mRNA interferase MazF